ncbi:MAG: DEAD/DEAH box helicase [Bacteroidetes bacterium]|nr:DEAD/DEAH box helicase [Bacteroidota bacterium]
MSEKLFTDLGLSDPILKAIGEMGFEKPTPVQEKTIPAFIDTDEDILALAQTGTGKTAAFGLPLMTRLDFTKNQTQALIICPTRELCLQISKDLKAYSKYMPAVKIVAVYGGAGIYGQIDELKRGAQIIVATPGRLQDLMERKRINITQVDYVVLDEADEMLNMGFRDDIESILSNTPDEKRVCLFSATMEKDVREIANKYLRKPLEVTIGKKNTSNENITHEYSVVHAKDKYAALKRMLDFNSDNIYAIVFCTTKNETQDISDKLIRDGYNSDCIHGDLSQQQREKVMSRFRHHAIKILCATDVAARGIDVQGLTHVIHFHLPDDVENYTHRSGRTARAGKTGISFTLLNMREVYKLRDIERISGVKFKRVLIPSPAEVRDKKLLAFIDTFSNSEINEGIFDDAVVTGMQPLLELDPAELIKKMISLELRRFSADYLEGVDLNVSQDYARRNDGPGVGGGDGGGRGSKLFINLGSRDGFNIDAMKELVIENCNLKKKDIVFVVIKGVYSFVEVAPDKVDDVLNGLNGRMFQNRKVRIENQGQSSFEGSGGSGPKRRSYGSRDGGGGSGGNRSSRSGGGGGYARKSEGGYKSENTREYGNRSGQSRPRKKY